MNKKLIAAAVAGAFVVPGVALAQVTISGNFNVGLSQGTVANPAAARAGFNTSSTHIQSAGALRFGMVEDLGAGTQFYGLWEIRPILDGYNDAASPNALASGSTTPQAYVGLRNASWGAIRAGNMALWSGRGSPVNPTAFNYGGTNLIDYQQVAAAGNVTSLASGRQRNLVYYESPQMGGFNVHVGYSTANGSNDLDLTAGTRKGSSIYIAPEFNAGFAKFGLVNANIKADATTNHYKGNKLYALGNFAGFNTGLIYAMWKGESAAGLNNLKSSTWVLPVSYKMGPHTFGITLAKASDNKNQVGDQSAKQTSIAYNYGLSKRTSVSLAYTRLNNGANAAFDLPSLVGTAEGVDNFTSAQGEDLRSITLGLHHSF